MKTTILSLTLAAAGGLAHAQNAAPAPSFTEPQAFNGYSQPDIKDCKTADATHRTCTVPAMTAGSYLIGAIASATSKGADAIEAVQIRVGNGVCAGGQTKAFTGPKSIGVRCVATFLTDQPITITAMTAVQDATAEPKGPTLVIERLPWTGVLGMNQIGFPAQPAQAAGKAPAAKPAPKKSEAPAE